MSVASGSGSRDVVADAFSAALLVELANGCNAFLVIALGMMMVVVDEVEHSGIQRSARCLRVVCARHTSYVTLLYAIDSYNTVMVSVS